MDENTKLIKSVMILNIITLVVVIVLLGLQVYQMVTVKPPVMPPFDQQKQTQKQSDSAGTSQNQQQNQQSDTARQQNRTMPMGQQMPSGQQQSGIQSEKCGDGICDNIEEQSGSCNQDCQSFKINDSESGIDNADQVSTESGNSSVTKNVYKSSVSPFGVGISNKQDITYAKDLNFKSVRLAGVSGAIWDLIKSHGYSQLDSIISEAYKNNLEIFVVVLAGNPAGENRLSEFSSFIASLVERYDGDGKDDAVGSPVVAYWEIDNEPDLYEGQQEKTPWKGDVSETADYAKVLQVAYKAAKSANLNAKLTIASMAYNLNYYESIFKELQKLKSNQADKFFDAFNYHYYGSFDDYGATKISATGGVGQPSFSFGEVKDLLYKYGYSDSNVALTETGTVVDPKMESTERSHAISLVKKYIYPIVHGVSRVHWLSIKANGDGPFDKLSLISSDSFKRLQYFSFKLLVEKLNGFDWSNIQIIQEKDGVYIYKFTKNGKPIWVAWNDNDTEKQITISGVNSSSVKITEATPNYSSGKEVANYNTAFSTKTANVENGKSIIAIKDAPVFVEEIQ